MLWKRLFATKSLEKLHAEMAGENRLRRILGPVGLTSLGVGAIIGSGIFVMTGQVAADDAGPAILLSFVVAGIACTLAAFCYAEFAAMAPVAGSAYTYAYATLGELLAWIIGWDLILEYAMSAATLAASWSQYLNELLEGLFHWHLPDYLCHDPSEPGAWFNLPAVLILAAVTVVLVIGIRESAASNTALVLIKVGVVIFVILVGWSYVDSKNWTSVPVSQRKQPEEGLIPSAAGEVVKAAAKDAKDDPLPFDQRVERLTRQAVAVYRIKRARAADDPAALARAEARFGKDLPQTKRDEKLVDAVLAQARKLAPAATRDRWGLLGLVGLQDRLTAVDDSIRSPFLPYGLSGLMLGAAMVFFAFIGFDSISTHAEEAIKPHRDVPIGILASLAICTVLYLMMAAVITGMEPYPEIDTQAAVAAAFRNKGEALGPDGGLLRASAVLIAIGALAGMTSVILITNLSQARIFLAMARDGLLPPTIFAAVHERFRTPHRSTIIVGVLMALVAAFTPINDLYEMVNIGTLFAFTVVCAAVLILRIKRPEAPRPFRCPFIYVVAPMGILVNLILMLFLPLLTWIRLVVWLALGLVIYFGYGIRKSTLGALCEDRIRESTNPST
jgi:basic amino acid/polyamine antiporter, APA family